MTVLRVAIGLVVCLSLMLRLAPPFELAVNYVVLTWDTQYVWPIVIYFGAAVGLFLALGGVLSALAGLGRAGALVAADFGLCCMVFLIIRQPFFSIAPTTPSVGQVALAYMHSLAAPRWSGRVRDEVPSSSIGVGGAQLNR
jgi:hypothetical protein